MRGEGGVKTHSAYFVSGQTPPAHSVFSATAFVAQASASFAQASASFEQDFASFAQAVLQEPSVVQQDAASLTAQVFSAPQALSSAGALAIPKTVEAKATAAIRVMIFFICSPLFDVNITY